MEKTAFNEARTCVHCKFSDRRMAGDNQATLVCRKEPPRVSASFAVSSQGAVQVLADTFWPQIMPGDWCGALELKTN